MRTGSDSSNAMPEPNASAATMPATATAAPADTATARPWPRTATRSPTSVAGPNAVQAEPRGRVGRAGPRARRPAVAAATATSARNASAVTSAPPTATSHGARNPGSGSNRAWLPNGCNVPAAIPIAPASTAATTAAGAAAPSRAATRSPGRQPQRPLHLLRRAVRGVVAQQPLPDHQQPARREHRREDRQADDEGALGRPRRRVAVRARAVHPRRQERGQL